jgi:hypothetical protein
MDSRKKIPNAEIVGICDPDGARRAARRRSK